MFSEVKRIDALGRINLGKDLANEQFAVSREKDGVIVLTPVAVIPKREAWLWSNSEAIGRVREGLQQSARSETHDLGAFGQYAEDED